jgi:hypothetical protein
VGKFKHTILTLAWAPKMTKPWAAANLIHVTNFLVVSGRNYRAIESNDRVIKE